MRSQTVFNIQKFSVNDGPGIRTVVFFKGCPLRCRWCANPESQKVVPQVLWDPRKCGHCRHCVESCSHGEISERDGAIVVDETRCADLDEIVRLCPHHALYREGEYRTIEDILQVVLQDEMFYEESGGGITLSGGEILAQPAFAADLLKAAREKGLHTCIETTGYGDEQAFLQILEYTDHVLIDFKQADPEKHRLGTGVANEKILRNIKHVIASGKPYVIRIPVIPFFNAALEDAREMAAQLKKMQAEKVQLLPFHQFGENKYTSLHQDYAYADVPALHEEELRDYLQVFADAGLDVFF